MIRNSAREFFKWLLIGRYDVRHGSRDIATLGGVMGEISGNIGAIPAFRSRCGLFAAGIKGETRC
jgi:hypothetical protein